MLHLLDWKMDYIYNAEIGVLSSDEIKQIDNYLDQFKENKNDNVVVSIDGNEQESYFTNSPEFGLPCDVYDCTIVVFKKG